MMVMVMVMVMARVRVRVRVMMVRRRRRMRMMMMMMMVVAVAGYFFGGFLFDAELGLQLRPLSPDGKNLRPLSDEKNPRRFPYESPSRSCSQLQSSSQ
jgi:hypothetical protein